MGRKSQYSKELKLSVVQEYLNGESSVSTLEKETNIHQNVIRKWIKKYEQYGQVAFDVKSKNSSYTKEFKEKVVKEYLDGKTSYLDLGIAYNISSSVIVGWVKVYNSHIELKNYIPGGEGIYMGKSRKTTPTERLEIVKYCIENDFDYKTAAKVYEVSYANVYNWVKKYKATGEAGLSDKRGRRKKDEEVDEIEQVMRQLKRTQHQLEMSQLEVRLLKKAEEIERRRYIEQVNMKLNTKQLKKSAKKK